MVYLPFQLNIQLNLIFFKLIQEKIGLVFFNTVQSFYINNMDQKISFFKISTQPPPLPPSTLFLSLRSSPSSSYHHRLIPQPHLPALAPPPPYKHTHTHVYLYIIKPKSKLFLNH